MIPLTALPPANPYLTPDIPGIGGTIKSTPEDFLVEETPLYQPCGAGTHTYLVVEKRGMTTRDVARKIADALGKPARDVGFAGLKDAQAVTRQLFSIEHVDPGKVKDLSIPGLRVISVDQHTNKLKIGHLAGNRFEIRIRDARSDLLDCAQKCLDVLDRRGLPNYFGEQRFGARGDNAIVGRHAFSGEYGEALAHILGRPGPADSKRVAEARRCYDVGDFSQAAKTWPGSHHLPRRVCKSLARSNGNHKTAWRAIDRRMQSFYLSAFQSELFNRVLTDRIQTIDRLENGDFAWKHANGACFHVADAATEQPRCEAMEISPTGPLFGTRMTWPSGLPERRELDVLSSVGLTPDSMRESVGESLTGGRRPLRVPIESPTLDLGRDERGSYVLLKFGLPPGSYATCVVREICKTDDESITSANIG